MRPHCFDRRAENGQLTNVKLGPLSNALYIFWCRGIRRWRGPLPIAPQYQPRTPLQCLWAAQLLIQGSKFLIQGSMQGLDFGLRCGIFGEMFRPRRRAANKSNSHLSLRRIWRPNGRGRVEWPPTEHFSVSE
jgi:hypothetical protein